MSLVSTVISVAKGEVGYHEGRSSDGHWNNSQKYSPAVPGLAWSQNQPWCATFVSWIALTAGAADLFPRTASCLTGVAWFKSSNRFSEYPAVGAQVFYGAGGGTHTGLVVAYDADTITTVEGNTNANGSAEGDGVYLKTRKRRDTYVYGYGYPAYPEGVKSADPAWANRTPSVGIKGLDVSSYQPEDYSLSVADFVVVKATEGTSYTNPKHAAQVARARGAKLVVGHYHFLRPGNLNAQMDRFLSVAAPRAGEFLALDWEDRGVSCADKDSTLRYLKSKAGAAKVLLYCNRDFWLNVDTTSFAADGLWIADYVASGQPRIKADWVLHQFADRPMDTSVSHWRTRADMAAWAGTKVATAPAKAPKPSTKKKPSVSLSKLVAAAKRNPSAKGTPVTYSGVRTVESALVKERLLSASYADGHYGTATIKAYAAWQRECGFHGHDADGVPGMTTLRKLAARHGFTVTA